jgi:CRP-like cAMP-binding protein
MSTNRFFLRSISIFQELDESEILLIDQIAEDIHFKSGEIVFRQGTEGRELYIIKMGEVEVIKEGGDGSQQLLTVLEAGTFFGEMSIVTEEMRSATIRALGECQLLKLQKNTIDRLADTNSKIILKIYKELLRILSERLRLTNEHYFFTKETLKRLRSL